MTDAPVSRGASPLAQTEDTVRACAEECQRIVDDAISNSISGPAFLARLKDAGATADEARDYIKQYTQRRRGQEAERPGNVDPPSGQINPSAPNPIDTATSIAWALLRAKVDHFQAASSRMATTSDGSLSDALENLLGLSSVKGAIPVSMLAKAPHLSKLSDSTATDPHLEKTQDLLSVYSPQGSQDILVNKAQFAPVGDPLPRTIWCKILLDLFVDFKKLFASMDMGYDHHDDLKDFGAGYALVKKDQAFSKCALRTEADWIWVFGTWAAGVAFFFPHREAELRDYQAIVMDLFRAVPANPFVAISFDMQVRDKYSKKPFQLNDQAQLNLPLLAQMLSLSSPNPPRTNKRSISSQVAGPAGNLKHVDVPCRNWSFGTCKAEICPNRRKHGICCICGEGHRAKDNEQCFALLQSRNRS
jgi:hypothetical protein